MDNGSIFPYHHMRVKAESRVLRKALRGLPTPRVVGQQWSDAEG